MIRKLKKSLLVVMMIFTTLLCGCGFDSGKEWCEFELKDKPEEFLEICEMYDEEIRIDITLKNVDTEKNSFIILYENDNFYVREKLKPGFYEVESFYSNCELVQGIELDDEKIVVRENEENHVGVYVTDISKMLENIEDMKNVDEITNVDKFSRKVIYKGELIDIRELLRNKCTITENVSMGERISRCDMEEDIIYEVINTSNDYREFRDCELRCITFSDKNVVFPQGVMVGMSLEKIVNKEDGLYFEPDDLQGSIWYGLIPEMNMSAVYWDKEGGDEIIIECTPDGKYVRNITYKISDSWEG